MKITDERILAELMVTHFFREVSESKLPAEAPARQLTWQLGEVLISDAQWMQCLSSMDYDPNWRSPLTKHAQDLRHRLSSRVAPPLPDERELADALRNEWEACEWPDWFDWDKARQVCRLGGGDPQMLIDEMWHSKKFKDWAGAGNLWPNLTSLIVKLEVVCDSLGVAECSAEALARRLQQSKGGPSGNTNTGEFDRLAIEVIRHDLLKVMRVVAEARRKQRADGSARTWSA